MTDQTFTPPTNPITGKPFKYAVRRYNTGDRFDHDVIYTATLATARKELKSLAKEESKALTEIVKAIRFTADRVEVSFGRLGGIAYYVSPATAPQYDRDAAK